MELFTEEVITKKDIIMFGYKAADLENCNDFMPEQRLAIAVLRRAYRDITQPISSSISQKRVIQDTAKAWMFGDYPGCASDWCYEAGIYGTYIHLRKTIEKYNDLTTSPFRERPHKARII